MYKIFEQWLIFFVVSALVISTVGTIGYAQDPSMKHFNKESERGGAKMAADLVFLRPVGIIATVIGTAVFVVSSPFSIIGKNSEEASEKLIKKPARFTFQRPLGDF
jgi:hypothetical protein